MTFTLHQKIHMSASIFFSTTVSSIASHTLEHLSDAYDVLATAYESSKVYVMDTLSQLNQACTDICSSLVNQYQEVVVYVNARWQVAKRVATEKAIDIMHDVINAAEPFANAVYNITSEYANGKFMQIMPISLTISST